MKTQNFLAAFTAMIVCSVAFLSQGTAEAKERKSKTADTVRTSSSAPAASSSAGMGGPSNFGLGVTTLQTHTTAANLGSGLAALFELGPKGAVQANLTLASTSPFNFAVGGLYKHNISGGETNGFHVGGGISLGSSGSETITLNPLTGENVSSSAFTFTLSGIAGMHFTLAGAQNIRFHIDGGATLAVTDGNAQFAIGGMSPIIGLSVFYVF